MNEEFIVRLAQNLDIHTRRESVGRYEFTTSLRITHSVSKQLNGYSRATGYTRGEIKNCPKANKIG